MAAAVPDATVPKQPFLERVGVRSLERLTRQGHRHLEGTSTDGVVHLLDDRERAALRRIERLTIARAAIAGAMSALAAALAEIFVLEHQDTRPLLFWAVVGGVSAVAAVLEIAFLSWDALRAVHMMSVASGALVNEDEERRETLVILARAALEVPNPPTSSFGIDPYRETRRAILVAAALLYKLKVSVTNVILKQLVRRALGRAAIRSWIVPLVSIPGTAIWNALVCAVVLREVRVRIFGPSLARDVVERLVPAGKALSPALAEALPRAVGACIVRSADVHPNLERLLDAIVTRTGFLPQGVDDSRAFLAALRGLPPEEQQIARKLVRAAAVMDGRIARRERKLLDEVAEVIGAVEEHGLVGAERRRVLRGEPLALP